MRPPRRSRAVPDNLANIIDVARLARCLTLRAPERAEKMHLPIVKERLPL